MVDDVIYISFCAAIGGRVVPIENEERIETTRPNSLLCSIIPKYYHAKRFGCDISMCYLCALCKAYMFPPKTESEPFNCIYLRGWRKIMSRRYSMGCGNSSGPLDQN